MLHVSACSVTASAAMPISQDFAFAAVMAALLICGRMMSSSCVLFS